MGYIDIEIISNDGMMTINSPHQPAAVAMCNCKPAPEIYTAMMNSQEQAVVEAKQHESNSFLNECQALVKEFQNEDYRKANIFSSMD